MLCPKCPTQNIEGAKFCVNCGHSFTNAPKKRGWWIAVSLLVFCLVWGGVVYGYMEWRNGAAQEKVETVASTTVDAETESESEPLPLEEDESEPASPESPKQMESSEREITDVIRGVQSRVYTILTSDGLGSGFLYDDNGTVVTNAHVVAGYTDVVVRDKNEKEYNGRVVGISDKYDVAVIKVDRFKGKEPLQMEMEPSDLGLKVIALGSPQGLENSASIGYLTGIDRDFYSDYFQYENTYQIDAQVSPGSSGGPLVDAKTGKVIGINSALLTDDGSIAFSIPLYTMDHLLAGWSEDPMTTQEVASVFPYYDEYEAYDEGTDYDEEWAEDEVYAQAFDEGSLSDFIKSFRSNYESALMQEDFSYIEDMLAYDSRAYTDLRSYINEIAGQGMIFEFTSNEVTHVDIQNDYAVARTFEVFDFMNAAGGWSVYERVKDYTVVTDAYGNYKITDITIHE